jgi:hypothetical protein
VEKTCSIDVRENVRVAVSRSTWAYGGTWRKPGCA